MGIRKTSRIQEIIFRINIQIILPKMVKTSTSNKIVAIITIIVTHLERIIIHKDLETMEIIINRIRIMETKIVRKSILGVIIRMMAERIILELIVGIKITQERIILEIQIQKTILGIITTRIIIQVQVIILGLIIKIKQITKGISNLILILTTIRIIKLTVLTILEITIIKTKLLILVIITMTTVKAKIKAILVLIILIVKIKMETLISGIITIVKLRFSEITIIKIQIILILAIIIRIKGIKVILEIITKVLIITNLVKCRIKCQEISSQCNFNTLLCFPLINSNKHFLASYMEIQQTLLNPRTKINLPLKNWGKFYKTNISNKK